MLTPWIVCVVQQAISRNPDLLLASGVTYGGPNDQMDTYLVDELHLSTRNVGKLKESAPFLFRLSTEKVRAVIAFLDSVLERGEYDEHERRRILGRVILSHPFLMNLSVKTNLEPRMNFLMERCHLKERDAATLIKSSPGILGLSVDENLRPTLEFLSNLLARASSSNDEDANVTTLRKCVLGHPQLLALSLTNLQQKVKYFNAIDTMGSKSSPISLACRVAIRSPVVYSLSLKHNIVPTVEFLAKAWGTTPPELRWESDTLVLAETLGAGGKEESLSSMLAEFPSILTLSLEGNIQPTLTFFNRTGYTCLDADWRLRSDQEATPRRIRGRYIAASLFNRLLPRWHHLIANGWPLGQGETPDRASTLPPLHILVGATDQAFCEQMGFEYQNYTQFKDQSMPRLKFSSQFDTWLKTGRPIDVT